MKKYIKAVVKEALVEITKSEKLYREITGQELEADWQQKLIKYETEGGYFVHFSDFPKMGLYLVNKFNTPIGFYSYFLDKDRMSDFAISRRYAIIFRPKPDANILYTNSYSETDLKRDIKKLVDMGYPMNKIEIGIENASQDIPVSQLWNITRVLSKADNLTETVKGRLTTEDKETITKFFKLTKDEEDEQKIYKIVKANFYPKEIDLLKRIKFINPPPQQMKEKSYASLPSLSDFHRQGGGPTGTWTMLLRKLGYDGVIDDCLEIVHTSEPCQAVFFDVTKLELVEIITLPKDSIKMVDDLFRQSIKVSYKDFSGQTLTKMNFSDGLVYKTSFKDSNLEGSDFSFSTLRDVNFENASLEGVNFNHTSLINVNLKDVNIEKASFIRSDFTNVIFKPLTFKNSTLSEMSFVSEDLRGQNFEGAELSGCNFTDANLSFGNFTRTVLQYTVFKGANLEGANFTGAKTHRIDLENANLKGVILRETNLPEMRFSSTDLEGASFQGCNLENSVFRDVNLKMANFTNANLYFVEMENINLEGANFTNAKLILTNLKNSNLKGAILTGSGIETAELEGATYNSETIFPEGFDPETAGMTKQ